MRPAAFGLAVLLAAGAPCVAGASARDDERRIERYHERETLPAFEERRVVREAMQRTADTVGSFRRLLLGYELLNGQLDLLDDASALAYLGRPRSGADAAKDAITRVRQWVYAHPAEFAALYAATRPLCPDRRPGAVVRQAAALTDYALLPDAPPADFVHPVSAAYMLRNCLFAVPAALADGPDWELAATWHGTELFDDATLVEGLASLRGARRAPATALPERERNARLYAKYWLLEDQLAPLARAKRALDAPPSVAETSIQRRQRKERGAVDPYKLSKDAAHLLGTFDSFFKSGNVVAARAVLDAANPQDFADGYAAARLAWARGRVLGEEGAAEARDALLEALLGGALKPAELDEALAHLARACVKAGDEAAMDAALDALIAHYAPVAALPLFGAAPVSGAPGTAR